MLVNNFRAFLADQLGFPSGWFGKLLVRFLNHNNAAMNDLVLQLLELQPGNNILEIGFGGGYLLHQIANTGLPALIVGIERSSDALNLCQRRFKNLISQGAIELYLADATELTFPDHHFTQICTVNTIYFWSEPLKVLAECYRVLAPRGKLIISYRSRAFLEKSNFSYHGFLSYAVEELKAMLKTVGFVEIMTVTRNSKSQEFICTCGVVSSLIEKNK
jgi:ubiquinone/menaquinone biosynthesis C-methylase UbiE